MPVLPGSTPDFPPVEVHLRRSGRARRFALRVSRLDGRVTLTLPAGAREGDALAFLRAQEKWLRRTLAALPEATALKVVPGMMLPVEGQMCRIVTCTGRAVRIGEGVLEVPGTEEQAGARIAAFLKVLARDRLARAVSVHAARIGRPYSRLTLRDTRSRWGSCSHDGGLMFSWRLILAPPSVLDYVVAHEVAHLAEMNHSPRFWAVVAGLCPGWRAERAWLHRHGPDLHRYRFAP